MKILKKVIRIFVIIVCVTITALLLLAATNLIFSMQESKKYAPSGQIFNIYDSTMHVVVYGETHSKTIVLMTGLGTSAPAIDFQPIIRELEDSYRIVVVEPYGYGWSGRTKRERSVENIADEYQQALQQANIEGPYTLMTHSVSGIYALYYANAYPNEVEALIGIDSTFPTQVDYFAGSYPSVPSSFQLASPLGLVRLYSWITPQELLPTSNAYSLVEKQEMMALAIRNTYNSNVLAEMNYVQSNIKKTNSLAFDTTLPILLFSTSTEKAGYYETLLTNDSNQQIVVIEGPHYLHWVHAAELAQKSRDFLSHID